MNLRNRLKKLETASGNGELCACYPRYTETYLQDLGEDAEHNEPVLTSKPTPDVCPNCRKPAGKRIIILNLCDHTTKERFPDEWKANNK